MKHHIRLFLFLLCLPAVLLVTCAKPKDQGTGLVNKIYTSSITGKVVDKNGNGLSKITVTARPGGKTTTSYPDGTFEISDLPIDSNYTLFFSSYNYNDTVVGTFKLGLDDTLTIPAPVKLIYRYCTLAGAVYLDAGKTMQAQGTDIGVEVENQDISAIALTGNFRFSKVEPSVKNKPVRVIAVKGDRGFGFEERIAGADTTISRIGIAISYNGGSVTGTVSGTNPSSGGHGKKATVPLMGVEVSAMGGVLHDITDKNGVYTLHHVPSMGCKIVLHFKINGRDTSIMGGVTAIEDSITSLPDMVIGASSSETGGSFTLLPAGIAIPSGGIITPIVAVTPRIVGDTVKILRYYWDFDGIPGTDDSTKTNWLVLPEIVFSWKAGESRRLVYVKARSSDGILSDSAAVTVVRTIPASPAVLTGMVTDKSGHTLMGVVVSRRGTARLDTTGINGGYVLNANASFSGADTLIFTRAGFEPQVLPVFINSGVVPTIALDTLRLPLIVADPDDASIADSSTAAFSVTANGTGIIYKWQMNDADIPGATAPSYTTPVMRTADSGTTFRCIVSNPKGSVTSERAVLRVSAGILLPSIVSNPQDMTIPDSSQATFLVYATGINLSYQWRKNDTVIPGATQSSYTTPVMRTADSGAAYRCIVSNPKGSVTSKLALLMVKPLTITPSIVSNPQDMTILDSSQATFLVYATGTNLSYQWQKNDTMIPGALQSSYTTPVMRTAGSGATYRCMVSNSAGSVPSKRALLTVTAVTLPPSIVSNPRDTTIDDSSRAVFQVHATGANLTYQWQKNNVDIADAKTPSYITPFMQVTESGSTFQCIVSNTKGTVTSNPAVLKIIIRLPLVIAEPKDAVVKERDSVQFSISGSGTAPLSFQWYTAKSNLAGLQIPGATLASYGFETVYSDSGQTYFCIITNSAGNDTSRTAILTVRRAPPLITLNPRDAAVYSGDPVIFTAAAKSSEAMNYQWQWTDTNGVTKNIPRAATASKYSITPTMGHNRMQFRCIVTNSAGRDTSLPARLIVTPAGIRQMKLIPAAKQSFIAGGLTQFATAGPPTMDTAHQVTFTRNYFMDSTEVTQSDFQSLMKGNPSKNLQSPIHPVEQVTWFDAALYCNARSRRDGLDTVYRYDAITGTPGNGVSALINLKPSFTANGYRLPTEAEFEYACHGGTATKYWWGNDTAGAGVRVWSWNNSAYQTRPVASKIANGYGLYDISGNVLEWCNDWFGKYNSATLTDPTGPASGTSRIARGGSVGESELDPNFRPQYRKNATPGTQSSAMGFRCVLVR